MQKRTNALAATQPTATGVGTSVRVRPSEGYDFGGPAAEDGVASGDDEKRVPFLSGPNGSGKTPLTRQLRADGVDLGRYMNPDDIALSLIGDAPTRSREAQRLVDAAREACHAACESFSFETVMSHPSKIELLAAAKQRGYRIGVFFVATESTDLNIARVRQRVALGGHDVPLDRIRARYERTPRPCQPPCASRTTRCCSTIPSADPPSCAPSSNFAKARLRPPRPSRAGLAPRWKHLNALEIPGGVARLAN